MSVRSTRCPCGGTLTFPVDHLYGRSIEQCDGPCQYCGPLRQMPTIAEPDDETRAIKAATDAKRANNPLCDNWIRGCPNRVSHTKDRECHSCSTKRRKLEDRERLVRQKAEALAGVVS